MDWNVVIFHHHEREKRDPSTNKLQRKTTFFPTPSSSENSNKVSFIQRWPSVLRFEAELSVLLLVRGFQRFPEVSISLLPSFGMC